jgi:neutral ceramidase
MKESNPYIDALVRSQFPGLGPTDALRRCQKPKAVLLATGLTKPPAQEQVLPVGLVRVGQLVLAVGPAEFTTMAGRRVRAALGEALGLDPRYVVIAGYANDYANYVTTREEYESQQYEGGSTLFGPWTEAAYRQEFVRLARAMKAGRPVASAALPADMRTRVTEGLSLDGPDERPPAGAKPGDVVADTKERFAPGELVTVRFWTGSPVNEYRRTDRFMAVQRLTPGGDAWQVAREDFDWDTTVRWKQSEPETGAEPVRDPHRDPARWGPAARVKRPEPYQVTVTWQTDARTAPGTYRIVHHGRFKKGGKVERFEATSRPFEVSR